MSRKIVSVKVTKEVPVLVRNEERDIGNLDILYLNTFQTSECHTDITAYNLSEQWFISLSQATRTLKKTTQKFFLFATLPLAKRYHTIIVFTRKTLK